MPKEGKAESKTSTGPTKIAGPCSTTLKLIKPYRLDATAPSGETPALLWFIACPIPAITRNPSHGSGLWGASRTTYTGRELPWCTWPRKIAPERKPEVPHDTYQARQGLQKQIRSPNLDVPETLGRTPGPHAKPDQNAHTHPQPSPLGTPLLRSGRRGCVFLQPEPTPARVLALRVHSTYISANNRIGSSCPAQKPSARSPEVPHVISKAMMELRRGFGPRPTHLPQACPAPRPKAHTLTLSFSEALWGNTALLLLLTVSPPGTLTYPLLGSDRRAPRSDLRRKNGPDTPDQRQIHQVRRGTSL